MNSADESVELLSVLQEYGKQLKDVVSFVGTLELNVQDNDSEDDNVEGISMLDVKNSLLLDYVVNLVNLSYRVLHRANIHGSASVDRLVELRTVLERIRPIEQKVSYHVEKLLNVSSSQNGNVKGNEDQSQRPRPDLLNTGDSDASGDEDNPATTANAGATKSNDTSMTSSKKYVPPKLIAMHYDDDNDKATGGRKGKTAQKQLASAGVLREMHAEYADAPTVASRVGDQYLPTAAARRRDNDRARTNYEEENFVRLQVGKKERRDVRAAAASATLDSLLELGDYHGRRAPTGGRGGGGRGGGRGRTQRGTAPQSKKKFKGKSKRK